MPEIKCNRSLATALEQAKGIRDRLAHTFLSEHTLVILRGEPAARERVIEDVKAMRLTIATLNHALAQVVFARLAPAFHGDGRVDEAIDDAIANEDPAIASFFEYLETVGKKRAMTPVRSGLALPSPSGVPIFPAVPGR